MKVNPLKYVTRKDGEWFHIPRHGHLVACCDCGLVHFVKSRVRNRRVEMSAHRAKRNTGQRRRWQHSQPR